MKTFVAVGVSAVLAFTITVLVVPRRPPTLISPSWFDLPGTPVSVNDQPVSGWKEVNELLHAEARKSYTEQYDALSTTRAPEHPGPEFQVTYRPHGPRRSDGSPAIETVVVRAWHPITLLHSRANHEQLARYEIVRPDQGL